MIGTSEAQTSTQRVSEILIDIASQFFLAVIVGLVMAVVANTFVEGARWFLNLSRVDSFISMQIGGANYNLDIFLTLAIAGSSALCWSGARSYFYVGQAGYHVGHCCKRGSASTVHWFTLAPP